MRTGRPKTRESEHMLAFVWRLVREHMWNRQSANLSATCRWIVKERYGGSLRIVGSDGSRFDLIDSGEKLRSRFYAADELRLEPHQHPLLAEMTFPVISSWPATTVLGRKHDAQAVEVMAAWQSPDFLNNI